MFHSNPYEPQNGQQKKLLYNARVVGRTFPRPRAEKDSSNDLKI